MSSVYLDPKIWGPHYWFFIHTVAMTYPIRPNAITKKKYYEFIQNLPLFIPVENMSGEFSKLLDKYPVTPYRALIGHSFGGIFALNVLANHKEIFDDYIVQNDT